MALTWHGYRLTPEHRVKPDMILCVSLRALTESLRCDSAHLVAVKSDMPSTTIAAGGDSSRCTQDTSCCSCISVLTYLVGHKNIESQTGVLLLACSTGWASRMLTCTATHTLHLQLHQRQLSLSDHMCAVHGMSAMIQRREGTWFQVLCLHSIL